jgi:NAD(P)-dependent dehydrogenase (short-subunit alcohol dehydrogenase family)
MNKRVFLGGVALGVAGFGLYRIISGQKASESVPLDAWTTANVPDMTGKVIIVTGANSGIGFEAAKEFARKGAQTVLACRSLDRAEAALEEIKAEIPDAPATIKELDLADLASVRRFADEFKGEYNRLDVLANNAGIMMNPYSTTADGFESQFGTNHLGHFALTGLLVDLLLTTPGSRVVNVSSTGHRFGRIDFDNLMFENGDGYSPARAYGRSKLANLLFTYELQRRYNSIDADAIAVAAHPGGSQTNLSRHLESRWYYRILSRMEPLIVQSAAMGALPTMRAATDTNVTGGQYYGPGGFSEQRGYPVVVKSSNASHDEEIARRLWEVSEELTGVTFSALDKTDTL